MKVLRNYYQLFNQDVGREGNPRKAHEFAKEKFLRNLPKNISEKKMQRIAKHLK